VTVGSADDTKTPGATAFVSQQDDKGNKWTVVYDKYGRIVKEVTKGRGN
jgi:YD repeat-containing protein